MRKTGRRLLVLIAVFFIAALAFIVYRVRRPHMRTADVQEVQSWESAALPVVTGESHGVVIDPLPGYTSEVNMTGMEDSLMLVGAEGRLPLTVWTEESLSSASWEIRTRDSSRKVAEGTVDRWETAEGSAAFTLMLRDVVAANGAEYRLILKLETESGRKASYYTRIKREDGMHAQEMLEFVADFHRSVFDRQTAEHCAVYLEPDQTADNSSFADVTIHSSYSNLTYGKLSPTQLGQTNFRVLEMDSSFGSFYLEYLIMVHSENDIITHYLCTEYFSIQWSPTRFYLMDYHRTMTELFSAEGDRLANGELNLGIQLPSEVQMLQSGDRDLTVFTAGGELWSYRGNSRMVTRLFTFRDNADDLSWFFRNYRIKALRAEDNGDVSFLVYGYMNRGMHEGMLGISCMTYSSESNSLKEKFFLPYTGTWETLVQDVEKLACMSDGGDAFLMAGDSLYSIDWDSSEIVQLADRISERNLVVNSDQTAVAWEITNEAGEAVSVQILYLSNGESQMVGANPGDWISPCGFIAEDCVLGIGHIGDAAVAGAVTVKPFYALEIRSRSGSVEMHYEKKNIYISSVEVEGDQVRLQRLRKKNGSLSAAKDDTLIENTADHSIRESALKGRNASLFLTTQRLTVDPEKKAAGELTARSPEGIRYASDSSLVLEEPKLSGDICCAYAEGKLCAVTESAGEAIALVYARMGAVTDRRGHLVWARTGRSQSVSLSGTGSGWEVTGNLRRCMRMILDIREMDMSALQNVKEEMSAMEAMNAVFPGQAVNLSGAPLRSLLYYIDHRCPVLLIDRSRNVLLLTGYDTYNIELYDPESGKKSRQGQKDATAWLENNNISAIGFLPDY